MSITTYLKAQNRLARKNTQGNGQRNDQKKSLRDHVVSLDVSYTTSTDSEGETIVVRVQRSNQIIDYHRTNRTASEIFDHRLGELHEFFSTAQDFATVMKHKRILDLGCGDGACVQDLKKLKLNIVGVDLHLSSAKKKPLLIQADAFALPFKDQSLDVIISIWSVFKYEPLHRLSFLLEECFRALSSRGSLLLSSIQDPVRLRTIRSWCEQNSVHVYQESFSKALHLIKG